MSPATGHVAISLTLAALCVSASRLGPILASTEPPASLAVASLNHVQPRSATGRRLQQFFNQIGFPFYLDAVLDIFDGVGYAGVVRPISTAVDRSLAQSQLCTTSAVARANLATCNNIPGFNALAVAG